MKSTAITQAIVREFLHYEPLTGALTWKLRTANGSSTTAYGKSGTHGLPANLRFAASGCLIGHQGGRGSRHFVRRGFFGCYVSSSLGAFLKPMAIRGQTLAFGIADNPLLGDTDEMADDLGFDRRRLSGRGTGCPRQASCGPSNSVLTLSVTAVTAKAYDFG